MSGNGTPTPSGGQNRPPARLPQAPARGTQGAAAASRPTPPTPPTPQPGSLLRRIGIAPTQWVVRPLSETFVRFDLNGLGDPFHRLLGANLNLSYGEPKKAVEALQQHDDLSRRLHELLDNSWASYHCQGAILIYQWRDEVKQLLGMSRAEPAPVPQTDEEGSDDAPADVAAPLFGPEKPLTCLRAIDLALVLNVLGRTRSRVLLAQTPLALEAGFLDRVLVSHDPRLVALARATGCLEELW